MDSRLQDSGFSPSLPRKSNSNNMDRCSMSSSTHVVKQNDDDAYTSVSSESGSDDESNASSEEEVQNNKTDEFDDNEMQKPHNLNDNGDDSDIEDDLVSAINYNTITSLAALKDMLQTSGENSDGVDSFFHHYFLSHVNRLPSRNQTHSPYPWARRLSECREEDEYESEEGGRMNECNEEGGNLNKVDSDLSNKYQDKLINATSKISSSSSSEKSSSDKLESGNHQNITAQESKLSNMISRFTMHTVSSPSTSKAFLKRRNTTGPGMTFPASDPPSHFSSTSILKTSSSPNPHFDKRFFDSSLIEMKSQASSSSTIDYDSTDEIWVRRPDILQHRKNKDLGSQPLPTKITEDYSQTGQLTEDKQHRPRAGTWGTYSRIVKHSTRSAPGSRNITPLPHQQDPLCSALAFNKSGKKTSSLSVSTSQNSSRSNSVERRQSSLDDASSHMGKLALFDTFRPRSKSEASKSRKPNIITNVKNVVQNTLNRGHCGNSSFEVSAIVDIHKDNKNLQDIKSIRPRAGSESIRNPVSKVIDLIRHRSHSAIATEDKRKAKGSVLNQSQALQGVSRKLSLDPDRRRFSLGTAVSHRSLDACVDPVHAAILFRDARGLPVVDPFLETVSIRDLGEGESQIFVKFFKFHKCYDLIPTSAKLVVFDTHLLVKKAFFALVYNGVRAAPLWDSNQQEFVGMLTITDFIKILQMYYTAPSVEIGELEEHELDTWRKALKDEVRPLISIEPEASLYDAITCLIKNKIHRLPVIDRASGNVLYILTHKRLLRFLFLYIHELPKPSFVNKMVKDLDIGTFCNIETATEETSIILALKKFEERRVSALPIVDKNGKLINIYSKFDVINLAAEKTYNNLDMSLREANEYRNEWFEGVESCKLEETLFSIMEKVVKAEVHRLIVVDDDNKVIGIISLSDLLFHLVLHPYNQSAKYGKDITDGIYLPTRPQNTTQYQ